MTRAPDRGRVVDMASPRIKQMTVTIVVEGQEPIERTCTFDRSMDALPEDHLASRVRSEADGLVSRVIRKLGLPQGRHVLCRRGPGQSCTCGVVG